MCKTNSSSNDCERRFFNASSLDIIWSSLTALSSFIIYFEEVHYEIFFSLKYLFHLFVPGLITLFCKNNFMEMWLLKHGFQNQLFPKYTENLTCDSSFWNIADCKIPTMLRQRGLDKKFQDNIHAKDNFLKLLKFVCRCPADVPRTSHDLVPGTFHNWVP